MTLRQWLCDRRLDRIGRRSVATGENVLLTHVPHRPLTSRPVLPAARRPRPSCCWSPRIAVWTARRCSVSSASRS